ncbi:Aspartic protease/pepsin like protease/pepsin-like protease [Blumeria hordei DH14]|uniref:Aspartic protease/pepsin like protease/pepsin-like protease n=1 Tax=Blumeria graminis f. sp. hordei (strain DH14) TaxID=546991 RepID=N1J5F9_BLUG1|nr:Aspartic protease/pepsin like protease/pepsin-like protease [Blumeria hordei DH14]
MLLQSQIRALVLLAIASLSIAAPSRSHVEKRSFKVARVPNPTYMGRTPGAGTRALIKAHRKFQFDLPQGLLDTMMASNAGAGAGVANTPQKAATTATEKEPAAKASAGDDNSSGGADAPWTNGTGKVTATPVMGDVEYLSPISIGGQTINMDFDSGSSDLWVFSSQLPAASIGQHTVYDSSKSSTFAPIEGATFKIAYGDGSGASGNVGTDTVNIGGATVTKQTVELATMVSQSFTADTGSNGLVGLAFSKLNTVKPTQQKTFFDNMIPNLSQPVFTADLRSNAVGAYEFGNIDSSKYNGSLAWAPIDSSSGFWQFSSTKFQVADQAPIDAPSGKAIADTGTTLMLTSAAIVNAYYSQVTGAVNDAQVGGVTFPCNSDLPDLKVDVGGNYMAVIRGSDINFAPVDNARTTCFGGVQAIQSPLQIYGDIMFKSQFVVFNGGNSSIGMAPHQ